MKTEAVRRVREARETVAAVARDLSVKAGSLYIWLRKADILDQP
ncbi:transposase [Luteibacter aegosomaticola]|nr:transposase [Luteibacter aegosomaticola]UPG88196.1 transposase [Luteibacter aegosomaticola]